MHSPMRLLPAFLLAGLTLGGCGKQPEPPKEPPVRPVKTLVVHGGNKQGIREFPARVDSLQKADVSFRVAGKIKEILVTEGESVKKGQLLARLDDSDYRVVLNDRQATYQRAKKDFERAKQLVKKGHISRADYDKLEAAFKSAQAALKAAQLELSYTRLEAPFAGTLAKRYVQQFEEVQAKQPVFALSDTSSLKLIFDVPENIIRSLKDSDEAKVFATFDTASKRRFELKFLEASTRADPQTQTFQLTFTMPRPKGLNILPGMTATVIVDLSDLEDKTQGRLIPLTAVTADAALEPIVWVVDDKDRVHARKVTLGQLRGADVQVLAGVEDGMRVVTAGTPYLAEGMAVHLLPEVEQAEPRPDDLRLILLSRCPRPAAGECAGTGSGGAGSK